MASVLFCTVEFVLCKPMRIGKLFPKIFFTEIKWTWVCMCLFSVRVNIAFLLYLSTCKDELEVRYKLHSSKDAEVLWSRLANVADGLLHSVSIRRLETTVSLQVIKKKKRKKELAPTWHTDLDVHRIRLQRCAYCSLGSSFPWRKAPQINPVLERN